MRAIKVLVVIDSLAMGGAERCAVDMACALDRSRFEPHVLVTRGTGPLAAVLQRHDVPYTLLDRRRKVELGAWRTARGARRDHGSDGLMWCTRTSSRAARGRPSS